MVVVIQSDPIRNDFLRNNMETNLMSSFHDEFDEIKVELFKGARSLGIQISILQIQNKQECDQKYQVFITDISEGGLLGSDGRIMVGDRLVAVKQYLQNGDTLTFNFEESYAGTDANEVKQILRRCKGRIELFIIRATNRVSELLSSVDTHTDIDVCLASNSTKTTENDKSCLYTDCNSNSPLQFTFENDALENAAENLVLSFPDECN